MSCLATLPLKNSSVWCWRVWVGSGWGLGLQEERPAFCASHKSTCVCVCVCVCIHIYIYIYIYQQHKHFSTTVVSGTGLSSRVEKQTGAVTVTLTASNHSSASCNIKALLHGLFSIVVSITIDQCQLPWINFRCGLLSIKIDYYQLFSTLTWFTDVKGIRCKCAEGLLQW